MIRKLKQILADHRAMQCIRANHGDVYLVSYTTQGGMGWECYVNQIDDPVVQDGNVPELAIIRAFQMYKQGALALNHSVVLTNMGETARELCC